MAKRLCSRSWVPTSKRITSTGYVRLAVLTSWDESLGLPWLLLGEQRL
jgi:hypothetical protein